MRAMREFKPDVVGIRSIVFFVEELQRLARLTRAHCGATIVVGGPIVEAWKARLFEQVPEKTGEVTAPPTHACGYSPRMRAMRSAAVAAKLSATTARTVPV